VSRKRAWAPREVGEAGGAAQRAEARPPGRGHRGLAIASTNDLAAGLAGVAEELRQYYEVAYAPANRVADGRFRRIGVKVSRPGVRCGPAPDTSRRPPEPDPRRVRAALMDALAADPPAHDFNPCGTASSTSPRGAASATASSWAGVPCRRCRVASDQAAGLYRAHLALLGYVMSGCFAGALTLAAGVPLPRGAGDCVVLAGVPRRRCRSPRQGGRPLSRPRRRVGGAALCSSSPSLGLT